MNARSSRREVVSLKVAVTHHGRSIPTLLHDLSVGGCMVITDNTIVLCPGDGVGLELPEVGATQGTLAWVDGNFAGVQFLHPLEKATVEQLRQLASNAPRCAFQDQFGRQVKAPKKPFGL